MMTMTTRRAFLGTAAAATAAIAWPHQPRQAAAAPPYSANRTINLGLITKLYRESWKLEV
jgi:hypothetical protein